MLKNKEKIIKWLEKYNINNYKLISDNEYGYVVNVNGNVDLYDKKLKTIDIKFNIIKGDFNCGNNKLKSLKGCPKIVKGDFSCHRNELTTLKDMPEEVNCDFICSSNNLQTLEGIEKLNIKILYSFRNNLNLIGVLNLLKSNAESADLSYNEELGELQNIKDLNEIKKILTIYQEKADLIKVLEVTDKSVVENKDKVNKI